MSKFISPKLTSITFGVLVLCFVIGFYAFAQWQEPGAEPPGGNVDVPINVGLEGQYKQGKLGVNTSGIDPGYGLTVGSSGIKVTGGSRFEGTVTSTDDFCIPSQCLSAVGGGMTNPMNALGDIIYGGAGGTPNRLEGAAGFLKSTGAVAPSWSSVGSDDVTFNYAGSGSKGGPATDLVCSGCVTSTDIGAIGACSNICTDANTTYGVLASQGLRLSGTDFGLYNTCANTEILKWNGTNWVCAEDSSGTGGAPTDASYIVMGLNGTLTAERVLIGGSGLSLSDGGAGGNATLNTGSQVGGGINVYADTIGLKNIGFSCGAGSALQNFNIDTGGGGCVAVGTGDITGVTAGSGLSGGGGGPGNVTLDTGSQAGGGINVYANTIGLKNIGFSCGAGSALQSFNIDTGGGGCIASGGGWSDCATIESNCNYVNESGDTMTGSLDMNVNSIFDVFQLEVRDVIYNPVPGLPLAINDPDGVEILNGLTIQDGSLRIDDSYLSVRESPNRTVQGDLIPTSNNFYWLGNASYKWNYVYRVNESGCALPTSNSAIGTMKKINFPEITSGDYGTRHYFQDEDFPEEMKYNSEIEYTRTLGVGIQAIRELIDKVEKLEKKVEELESR